MSRHLVLVGGGHLHLPVLKGIPAILRRGHRVTVVSPEEEQVYSGMGPGVLGGFYTPAEATLPVRRLVEAGGGTFVRDSVLRIDAPRRRLQLAEGGELDYDIASFNVGSVLHPGGIEIDPDAPLVRVKPLASLLELSATLPERVAVAQGRLAVIGGGPAGVELAGNLAYRLRASSHEVRVLLIAGSGLLRGFAPGVALRARAALRNAGVTVLEGVRVKQVTARDLVLSDGERRRCGLVLLATGIRPSPLFRESGLPVGPEGGLLVDPCLKSPAYPELFGGGDAIDFDGTPLPRVGVFAVRQGPVLARNLMAALEGHPLAHYRPQARFLLIMNLGDGRGLAVRPPLYVASLWAFRFKEALDRAFVRKYQTL